MLSEFEAVEHSFGAEKAGDLRKALHFLLRHQFVFAGDRGTGAVYNTIMDGRFRPVVDSFFDSCGYTVHRDPEAQWAGIVAADGEVPLPRMKLDETIVMLVPAAQWQDEVNVGAVEDRATVVTTLNVLYDRYREMVQAKGRSAIPSGRFHEILKEAAQRNMVEIGDFDPDEQDYPVSIRPMIKLVCGSDALAKLERYAREEEARTPSGDGGGS